MIIHIMEYSSNMNIWYNNNNNLKTLSIIFIYKILLEIFKETEFNYLILFFNF